MRFAPHLTLALLLMGRVEAARAQEQDGVLLGRWAQVESNAGPCPACGIEVRRAGAHLTVAASNGWSAEVRPRGAAEARGPGRWGAAIRGPYRGRAFDATFVTRQGRLHMTMVVDAGGGRRWTVDAVFERSVWLGV